jgi:hypothetical protein
MFTNAIGSPNGVSSGSILSIYDGASNKIFDFFKATNIYDMSPRLYGATTSVGASYPIITGFTYYVDIALTIPGSGGTMVVEIFINGVSIGTLTATNTGTVKGQPRQMQITFANLLDVVATGINFSEFIATVDESTIGLRLATFEPSSAGSETNWIGTTASIADVDSGSGISTINANDRFTSIFTAYGGPTSPAGFRGLFLKATPGSSSGGPTQLDQHVKISSTDYDGTPATVVTGIPQMREMALNPATSGQWDIGSFAALEAGVRAVA